MKAGTRDVFTLRTEQKLNLVGHWNFKDNVKYHLSVANTYHDYKVQQTYFISLQVKYIGSTLVLSGTGLTSLCRFLVMFLVCLNQCGFLTSISHCHHV